jgi:hypothetical protein
MMLRPYLIVVIRWLQNEMDIFRVPLDVSDFRSSRHANFDALDRVSALIPNRLQFPNYLFLNLIVNTSSPTAPSSQPISRAFLDPRRRWSQSPANSLVILHYDTNLCSPSFLPAQSQPHFHIIIHRAIAEPMDSDMTALSTISQIVRKGYCNNRSRAL